MEEHLDVKSNRLKEFHRMYKMVDDTERLNNRIFEFRDEAENTRNILWMSSDPRTRLYACVTQNMDNIVHMAVRRRDYVLLTYLPLVSYKCPRKLVTLRNGQGYTPLHLAAELYDDPILLELLLKFDCDCCQATSSVVSENTSLDSLIKDKRKAKKGKKDRNRNGGGHCELNSKRHPVVDIKDIDHELVEKTSLEYLVNKMDLLNINCGNSNKDSKESNNKVKEIKIEKDGKECSEITLNRDSTDMSSIEEKPPLVCGLTDHVPSELPDTQNLSREIRKYSADLLKQRVMGTKETMLHLAAKGCHLDLVTFLLGQGSEVNAMNLYRNTPLHLLVIHNQESQDTER